MGVQEPLRLNYDTFIDLSMVIYWKILPDGRYDLWGTAGDRSIISLVELSDVPDFETNHKNPLNGVETNDEGETRIAIVAQELAVRLSTDGVNSLVVASANSVTILVANSTRVGFTVRNTSLTATLYLLANTAGGPASLTNHTVALMPQAYYEDPYRYVGDVFGIWGAPIVTGDLALVTEYV